MPKKWPDWWDWDIDCENQHVQKRMMERGFNELELREMLEKAENYLWTKDPCRFLINSTYQGMPWQIVIETDSERCILVVVTAYPIDPS